MLELVNERKLLTEKGSCAVKDPEIARVFGAHIAEEKNKFGQKHAATMAE